MEIPVLPVNGIAGNGVVFAFRFSNIQRFHRRGVAVATIIRTGLHWDRDHRTFFDFDDFLRFKVDHRHQVFNRVRPVVAVAGIQITDHLQQTRILLQAIFAIKKANGERGGDHFAGSVIPCFFSTSANSLLALMMFCTLTKSSSSTIPWAPLIGVEERIFILQINHGFNDVFAIEHHHIGSAGSIDRRSLQGKGPYRRLVRLV